MSWTWTWIITRILFIADICTPYHRHSCGEKNSVLWRNFRLSAKSYILMENCRASWKPLFLCFEKKNLAKIWPVNKIDKSFGVQLMRCACSVTQENVKMQPTMQLHGFSIAPDCIAVPHGWELPPPQPSTSRRELQKIWIYTRIAIASSASINRLEILKIQATMWFSKSLHSLRSWGPLWRINIDQHCCPCPCIY